MGCPLELVDSVQKLAAIAGSRPPWILHPWPRYRSEAPGVGPPRDDYHIQLLKVTIGNIMAAPVGHCVKLETVRELHVVLCVQPPLLLLSGVLALSVSRLERAVLG